MEITVGLFLSFMLLAFCCELIDATLGMGYGTILTPILLLFGIDPLVAIPAVLVTQAFGGLTASIFHHRFKNFSLINNSKDFRIFLILTSTGIIATIFAAIVSINIPRIILRSYIGLLVLGIGIMLLVRQNFHFSWRRIYLIGFLSAFNKGISGGGFGPLVTGGQILAGQNNKNAIGVTTLSEGPICIVAFFTYLLGRAIQEIPSTLLSMPFSGFCRQIFSRHIFQWELVLALFIGSVMVAPFGALLTKKVNPQLLHIFVAWLMTGIGMWSVIKIWL